MADDSKAVDFSGIQVCVRARPLNDREREGGFRNCISFDEATQQVVLSAVDKNTLLQLRGQTAKGYAFDRRYGPEHTSDNIYDDCVCHLVDNLFKGYNATVLAYGQTGSGKTLTMSGGRGIFGNTETGIIRRAAQHILSNVEAVQAKLKPGESITVRAYALELYNEELRDLSGKVVQHQQQQSTAGGAAAAGGQDAEGGVRIAERPVGKDGRCIPEVVGVTMVEVADANSLVNFFAECFDNRAVAATKMNDRSSRSHAIYTVLINRTLVDVSEVGDKVRTVRVESRFNLVDLAGSERVKRSGVTGAAFKEAVHINGGLLALGNVIVALSGGHEDGPEGAEGDKAAVLNTGGSVTARAAAKKHIPYRDSKLTRLLQDSLGGSALTVLISCISSCEADFEETNSTLKYANRACRIKNSPLPNKQLLLEEDLLPLLPANATASGNMSMMQMQMLLAEHNKMKEAREKREAEKKEKEEKRLAELRALREAETKAPGFQRLRMAQYDELRKKLVSSHGGKLVKGEIISDDTLAGFKKRNPSDGEGSLSDGGPDGRPHFMRPTSAGAGRVASPVNSRSTRPASATRLYSNQRVRGSNAGSPWDTPRSNSTSTPDILSVEASPNSCTRVNEDAQQQQQQRPRSGRSSSRSSCRSSDAEERSEGYASRPSSASRRISRQMHEMSVGTDEHRAGAAAGDAGDAPAPKLKAAVMAVDEGTCTSPMGSGIIKACYEFNGTEDSSCQAAAVDAGSSHSRRSSISRATSATPAALAGSSNTISRATSAMPSAFGSAAAQASISSALSGTAAALAEASQQASGSISRADSAAPTAAAASSPSGRPPLAPGASPATGSYAALHSQSAAYTVLAFNQPEGDVEQQQPQQQQDAEAAEEPELVPVPPPQLLARFRVNQNDTLAVFRAVSTEDFADVASLLPPNTALPAADKMTYLLARLEVQSYTSEQLCAALDAVASGAASITAAVGPAVGCLMATFGTSLITDCIFDFEDPEQLADVGLQQRLELWGLQIPHTSIRPALSADDRSAPAQPAAAAAARGASPSPGEVTPRRSSFSQPSAANAGTGGRRSSAHSQQAPGSSLLSQQHSLPQQLQEQQQQQQPQENVTCWSSADRLNVSIGLMYALCNLAKELGAAAGFCVPRPQLLRRWLQSGVKMKQVSPPTKLIYPPSAHDYTYYKSSTVAYFLVDEVKESLGKVLSMLKQAS